MIRKDICTRTLADGTKLSIPVFHFPGSDADALKVYIQSGIHGAEVQGYLVALQLIETFLKDPPRGDVTIVPMANPYAMNVKGVEYTIGRFDPVTGENWNRNYIDFSSLAQEFLKENSKSSFAELMHLFKSTMASHIDQLLEKGEHSYAQKIAWQLQRLAVEANIVLDLHCDTISVPHVYSASYAIPSASRLGIPFLIEIPHQFGGALDEAIFCPWVALTEQYNTIYNSDIRPPIEVFTVELGSQESIVSKDAAKQTKDILSYLSAKGVTRMSYNNQLPSTIYSCKLEHFKTIYAPSGGIILNYPSLGTLMKKGDELFTLSKTSLLHSPGHTSQSFLKDMTECIPAGEEMIVINHAASPIVHESMALMKVMTQCTAA